MHEFNLESLAPSIREEVSCLKCRLIHLFNNNVSMAVAARMEIKELDIIASSSF